MKIEKIGEFEEFWEYENLKKNIKDLRFKWVEKNLLKYRIFYSLQENINDEKIFKSEGLPKNSYKKVLKMS